MSHDLAGSSIHRPTHRGEGAARRDVAVLVRDGQSDGADAERGRITGRVTPQHIEGERRKPRRSGPPCRPSTVPIEERPDGRCDEVVPPRTPGDELPDAPWFSRRGGVDHGDAAILVVDDEDGSPIRQESSLRLSPGRNLEDVRPGERARSRSNGGESVPHQSSGGSEDGKRYDSCRQPRRAPPPVESAYHVLRGDRVWFVPTGRAVEKILHVITHLFLRSVGAAWRGHDAGDRVRTPLRCR